MTKQCAKCHRILPVSAFNRYREKYLQSRCKECHRIEVREAYRRDPETGRVKEYRRRAKRPERVKASLRKWYARNAEQQRIDHRIYRATRTKEQREKMNDYWRQYYRENPGWAESKEHKRRACKAQSHGSFTPQEWRNLVEFYGHHCLRCGNVFDRLSVDHVIPLSKGGSNLIENLQPLCKPCNRIKHVSVIDYRPLWENWCDGASDKSFHHTNLQESPIQIL